MIDTVVSTARSLWSKAPLIIGKADEALKSAAVWAGHAQTVGQISSILDCNKDHVMEDLRTKCNNASRWITAFASNATSVASTGSKWVSSHTPSTVSSIASGVTSYAPSLEASTLAWGAAALTGLGLAYTYLTRGSESVVTETVETTNVSPNEDNDKIGGDSAEGNTTARTVNVKEGRRRPKGGNSSSGP